MKQNDLPYHPLYEKGYPSIGCNPLSCTRPVQIGGDERSERWAEADKLECGINLTNSLDSAARMADKAEMEPRASRKAVC